MGMWYNVAGVVGIQGSPDTTGTAFGITENVNDPSYLSEGIGDFLNNPLPALNTGIVLDHSAPLTVDGNQDVGDWGTAHTPGTGSTGWMGPGHFFDYLINVTTPGKYQISVTYSNGASGQQLDVQLDTADVGTLTLPASDSTTSTINLAADGQSTPLTVGLHTIRLTSLTAGLVLDSITLTPIS